LDRKTVYGTAFTVEETDYLDSRAESDARRTRGDDEGAPSSGRHAATAASRATRATAQ
jgi:single-strand DNA-binding protein